MGKRQESILRIGIVGAGYSGTALAAYLYNLSAIPIEITLIERRGRFGEGEAYSTPHPFHLLNVRAQDMSAFQNDPNHFVNWLCANHDAKKMLDAEMPVAEQFAPRLLYARYLKDLLHTCSTDTSGKGKLILEPAEAVDIVACENQARLILNNQKEINVDKVVLAIGNNQPGALPFPVSGAINVIDNPWNFTAPRNIPASDPVLIIGTGLSMVDAVLTLHNQKHQGKIFALSRHGLLPLPHVDKEIRHDLLEMDFPEGLRKLMKALRAAGQSHMSDGGDWRSVVNAVRSHVAMLWSKASIADKKRFLRHVLPYWNIHRHRVHNKIAEILETLIATQQLNILAGRVMDIENSHATIKLRHSKELSYLKVKWVINCMGPALKMTMTQHPLVGSLLRQGLATMDSLSLGFATNPAGALLEASGKVSTRFYSLGPPTKGVSWECSSVPDIRRQCDILVKSLLSP